MCDISAMRGVRGRVVMGSIGVKKIDITTCVDAHHFISSEGIASLYEIERGGFIVPWKIPGYRCRKVI